MNTTLVLTGDSGTAYAQSPGGPLTAVDVTTWTPKWTTTAPGEPVMAATGGGLALLSNGTMSVVDTEGTAPEPVNLGISSGSTATDYGFWLGVSTATGALAQVAGPNPGEALFSFVAAPAHAHAGNREKQNAATDLRQGIYAKAHDFRDLDLRFRHISLAIIPRNQAYWRAQEPSIFNKPVPGSADLVFGTLGAGPVPGLYAACVAGVLTAEFNREDDWQQPPSIRPERLKHPLGAEDLWILELIARQRAFVQYHNGELDYACPPITSWEDGWNSNGYARGLLEAAGLPLPAFPTQDSWWPWPGDPLYSGWQKPVPADKFQLPEVP